MYLDKQPVTIKLIKNQHLNNYFKMITILYLLIVDVSLVMITIVEKRLGIFTGVTNTK